MTNVFYLCSFAFICGKNVFVCKFCRVGTAHRTANVAAKKGGQCPPYQANVTARQYIRVPFQFRLQSAATRRPAAFVAAMSTVHIKPELLV